MKRQVNNKSAGILDDSNNGLVLAVKALPAQSC